MKAEEQHGGDHEVACPEARAELDRLLADERFRATERSRSILRYIVKQQFAGCAEGVKAYSIAVDVLGRQSNFDPSLDPIVRIELSRLRSSLSQYYEAYGEEGGVTVQLPRGRYVAVFTRSTGGFPHIGDREHPATACAEPADFVLQQAPSAVVPAVPARPWVTAATLGLLTVAVVAYGVAVYGSRPITTAKPTVAVTLTAVDEGLRGEASVTRDMLLTALTQFQTLTVSQAQRRERPLASVLRPAKSNAYAIDMKYYGDGDDRSIWWQIVDTATGDLLKSGLESVDTSGRTAAAVRDELVAQLARRFAATRGVINNIETHAASEGSLGNACVLRAEYQLDDGKASSFARTIDCLERTIAANSFDADATAALSALLAQAEAADDSKIARALELAGRAVSLAPLSDRAHVALMLSQFYSGRVDAAIAAGNRALALNPNNPDASAKLGLVLFSSGYFDAGVSLARDAGRSVDVVPSDAVLVLALDAYRRKDWSEASLLSEQVSDSTFLIGVLRVAALGQLGSDEAVQRLAELRQLAPDFETTFRERMAPRRYQQVLSAAIEEGLTKAGARFKTEGLATAF